MRTKRQDSLISGIDQDLRMLEEALRQHDIKTAIICVSTARAQVRYLIDARLPLKPKRTLRQYTLDGELVATHKNCADASRAIDGRATRQDISLAARGKAHAAGGYRWQW